MHEKFQRLSFLLCLSFVHVRTGDYSVVAQYSEQKPQAVYAIDVNEDSTSFVATTKGHRVLQFLLQKSNVAIDPGYIYDFRILYITIRF